MTDNRPFTTAIPQNDEICAANLGRIAAQLDYSEGRFAAYSEPHAEAVPVHPFEERNIQPVRGYVVDAGERQFKIYRGGWVVTFQDRRDLRVALRTGGISADTKWIVRTVLTVALALAALVQSGQSAEKVWACPARDPNQLSLVQSCGAKIWA